MRLDNFIHCCPLILHVKHNFRFLQSSPRMCCIARFGSGFLHIKHNFRFLQSFPNMFCIAELGSGFLGPDRPKKAFWLIFYFFLPYVIYLPEASSIQFVLTPYILYSQIWVEFSQVQSTKKSLNNTFKLLQSFAGKICFPCMFCTSFTRLTPNVTLKEEKPLVKLLWVSPIDLTWC